MCLKPQPPRPMPEETGRIGAALLADGSPYRFVGDVVYEQFADEEFADLYPRDGQPTISPVLLSFVTIFQYLEDLSDRDAVLALKDRISWKYALHLPLEYASFDHTVLVEFRARLRRHGAEGRIFTAVLARLKALGMYKERGVQRTDSLAVESPTRPLRRLELVSDAIRVAVKELLRVDPDWTRQVIPLEWEKKYGRPCKTARMTAEEREKKSVHVGRDGQWLLDRLDEDDAAHLRELRDVATFRLIWQQHYMPTADGTLVWTLGGDHGGAEAIETPYDPEARWSKKGDFHWIGDKLQVTETDDADYPHLITDIDLGPATESDYDALDAIRARQKARSVLPGERYVDSGYVSGGNIRRGRDDYGEDLIGPIRAASTPQSKLPGGLTHADFDVDWDGKQVTCPQGHTVTITTNGKRPELQATFPARVCRDCPLRPRCCTGKKEGRTLRFSHDYPETQAARSRQTTEDFKTKYRTHRSGIEGCLSALVWGHGIRRNRYRRRATNRICALGIGAAVNLARAAAWRAGYRPPKHQPSLRLIRPTPTPAVPPAA
ncbi:MAG: IS1182 family transposase [Blastochloris sp.]|nr:IS1182 family transposase [Blastochloris sp.]